MIRKWRNRFLIYMMIAALLAIIGVYFYLNMKGSNDTVSRLKEEGVSAKVEMKKLGGAIYSGDGSFYWGYDLPSNVPHNKPEVGFDAATIGTYTLEQYEAMGHMIDIYYLVDEDGNYITYDKAYVDAYRPFDYFESIFLWCLTGVSAAIAFFYLGRNILYMVVAAKGVECIGQFEEAYHTKFGTTKYFKVKYTYTFNGELFTADSPAIYSSQDADRLKAYGTLPIKMLGKITVIDRKL